MTETTILNESAVSEIEARRARCLDNKNQSRLAEASILIASDIPALCATVKHLRANPRQVWKEHPNRDGSGKKCTECSMDNRFHAYECFFLHPSLKISEESFNALYAEKSSLQSQLEQLRAENERLQNVVIPDSISDLVRRIDAAIRFTVPIQQQAKLRSYINELIFLNGSLRSRAIQICKDKAVVYQNARNEAYTAVPTCDAVGENEIRQSVAEILAQELEKL